MSWLYLFDSWSLFKDPLENINNTKTQENVSVCTGPKSLITWGRKRAHEPRSRIFRANYKLQFGRTNSSVRSQIDSGQSLWESVLVHSLRSVLKQCRLNNDEQYWLPNIGCVLSFLRLINKRSVSVYRGPQTSANRKVKLTSHHMHSPTNWSGKNTTAFSTGKRTWINILDIQHGLIATWTAGRRETIF